MTRQSVHRGIGVLPVEVNRKTHSGGGPSNTNDVCDVQISVATFLAVLERLKFSDSVAVIGKKIRNDSGGGQNKD